jgi:hypothetical protein
MMPKEKYVHSNYCSYHNKDVGYDDCMSSHRGFFFPHYKLGGS